MNESEVVEIGAERMQARERRKRIVYGLILVVFGASLGLNVLTWDERPVAAVAVLMAAAATFTLIGVQQCMSVRSQADPVKDRRFAANLLWASAIFVFVGMTATAVGTWRDGGLVYSGIGLGVLIVASVNKLIVEIQESEQRLRELFLVRRLS